MEGVGQVNIWEHVPLTWKTAIRSMIERGEIDDNFERASRVSTMITYHMSIMTGQKVGGIVFVYLSAMDDSQKSVVDRGLFHRTRDYLFRFFENIFGIYKCEESNSQQYRFLVGEYQGLYWLVEVENNDDNVPLYMYKFSSTEDLMSYVKNKIEYRRVRKQIQKLVDKVAGRSTSLLKRLMCVDSGVKENPGSSSLSRSTCICQRCNKLIAI